MRIHAQWRDDGKKLIPFYCETMYMYLYTMKNIGFNTENFQWLQVNNGKQST